MPQISSFKILTSASNWISGGSSEMSNTRCFAVSRITFASRCTATCTFGLTLCKHIRKKCELYIAIAVASVQSHSFSTLKT